MNVVNSIAAARQQIGEWRQAGLRVAFVPTMGNLHEGHLALVNEAQKLADKVVASIFVNPMQFGPNEDYDRYPRTLEQDSAKLSEAGVALLFAPSLDEIYPPNSSTCVEISSVSTGLCGDLRPGHFVGVATVVAKLFNIVTPDVALFGEKDYQQLQVIQRMAADLCFPVEVVGVSTVREENGLAMSSRNGYLSGEEKQKAALIYQVLQGAAHQIEGGERGYRQIESAVIEILAAQGFKPEYFAIRNAETLAPAESGDKQLRILVAAKLGQTRLIDNMGLCL
ncbi:pantoate--beta-alanine ligase [Pseudomonadota bacterium]